MSKALGSIEVRGKLGAILAADEAVKTADVILLGSEVIRGGLTTIHLIGDVAAVKSAVEAGELAVADKNCLISSNVIPRLDKQVERMLMESFSKRKDEGLQLEEINESIVEEDEDISDIPMNESEEIIQEDLEDEVDTIPDLSFDKGELEKMKVVDLRSLAYKLNLPTIEKSEIKFANKSMLIEVLSDKGVDN
ncbi:MAG: BMC domain-containing protein [Tissierella sp.]|nr:BMC domain-containing protein [Tissierella sp.]